MHSHVQWLNCICNVWEFLLHAFLFYLYWIFYWLTQFGGFHSNSLSLLQVPKCPCGVIHYKVCEFVRRPLRSAYEEPATWHFRHLQCEHVACNETCFKCKTEWNGFTQLVLVTSLLLSDLDIFSTAPWGWGCRQQVKSYWYCHNLM